MVLAMIFFRKSFEIYRKKKVCPVKGCTARAQKKLSNHIIKMHPEVTTSERCELLKVAKVAPRNYVPPKKGQVSLRSFAVVYNDESSDSDNNISSNNEEQNDYEMDDIEQNPSDNVQPIAGSAPSPTKNKRSSTRSLPMFDIKDTTELDDYYKYLQGVEGREKSTTAAKAIVVDISKFVKFASPNNIFDWNVVTNRMKIAHYLNYLRDEYGMGPEGLLSKLERISDCLKYLLFIVCDEDKVEVHAEIGRLNITLDSWKNGLRNKKKKLAINRLEGLAELDYSLNDINKLIENKNMWSKYNMVVKMCKKGLPTSYNDLKFCVAVITVTMIYKSWARQGAVINCTISEYKKITYESEDNVYIIQVKDHKTGVQGSANLMFEEVFKGHLDNYYQYIRPRLICKGKDIPNLFILKGSKKINRIVYLIKYLEDKLNISLPSPTMVRKVGATAAAKQLDNPTNTLIAKQLAHDPRVSAAYYRAVGGKKNAAKAFTSMEGLRQKEMEMTVNSASSKSKYKKWLKEDTDLLTDKMSTYIYNKEPAPMHKCEELIQFFPGRTAKQIKDKIRYLSEKFSDSD